MLYLGVSTAAPDVTICHWFTTALVCWTLLLINGACVWWALPNTNAFFVFGAPYALQHRCPDVDQETDGTFNFKVEPDDRKKRNNPSLWPQNCWLVMEGVIECVGGMILSGICCTQGFVFETLALRPADPLVWTWVGGCLLNHHWHVSWRAWIWGRSKEPTANPVKWWQQGRN
jgi:hypothetical protein